MEGALFLDSGRDQEFIIAREDRHGLVIVEPVVQSAIANIRAHDIAVVKGRSLHRVPWRRRKRQYEGKKVVRQWARIAQETDCAVELVHHVRKSGGGHEPTADDARGASALVNAARSVRILRA